MQNFGIITVVYLTLLTAACSNQPPQSPPSSASPSGPYQQEALLNEADIFFGQGAQDLAAVLNKAFNDHGSPDA